MKYNFGILRRFSFLLPYGSASPLALELSIPDTGMASLLFDPDIPMSERLDACDRAHRNRHEALYATDRYGYIEKVKFKADNANIWEITTYRLTQAGFHLLAGVTDEETEAKRRQDHPHNLQRSRNGESYQWTSPEHHNNLFGLNILSQFPREIFEDTIGEFIKAGSLSILASQMQKAPDVKITPSTKGDIRYRQYRLSNVNALFQGNGFLTTIDRLPLDCRIPVQDIYNLERKSILDVETYCNYALYQWYRDHPYSYTFSSPAEDPSADRYDAWLRTPAFYPLSIVPGFEPYVQDAEYKFRKIAGSTFHHTCIGVACGTNANYVVYHTKPVASKWNKSLEEDSRTKIARALSAAAGDDPYEPPSKHDGYALMICPTVHQFKALFSSKRNGEHPKGRIDAPYQAISIVPINHSGLEQIRRLMLSTPIIEEQIIANYLVDHFEDFTHTYDTLFPVTYQSVPVLIAHMMNLQKLFQAKQLYEKGHHFCISCFPQQVKFLRSIMPDAEYI